MTPKLCWVSGLSTYFDEDVQVTEYAIDGIRLDTTPYMTHEFLQEVQDASTLP